MHISLIFRVREYCPAFSAAVLTAFAINAHAQPISADLASAKGRDSISARFPAGGIQSIETADSALAEATKERSEIEGRFSREEGECHSRFFATSCIDQAKERRRLALLQVRRVEREANTFKRQSRVDSREEAMEIRKERQETDRAAHIQREEEESRRREKSRISADSPAEITSDVGGNVQKDSRLDRRGQHDARVKHAQEKDAADAAKRAENIAAYERKVRSAKERQAEVAARKAEKERKRQSSRGSLPPVAP